MQQSNVIFGALLIAFIVFITLRGELPTYITILRGGNVSPSQATSTAANSSGLSGTISTVESQAANLLAQDPGILINASSLGQ